MEKLTRMHCSEYSCGYRTHTTKKELIARLAQYENAGVPPEKIKQHWDEQCTEQCPFCGEEVHIVWNVNTDGYEIYCPRCGEPMMLCDECTRADDYKGCDWETTGCWRKNSVAEEE